MRFFETLWSNTGQEKTPTQTDKRERYLRNREEYVSYLVHKYDQRLTELDAVIKLCEDHLHLAKGEYEALIKSKLGLWRRRAGSKRQEIVVLESKLHVLRGERSPLTSTEEVFREQYDEIMRIPRVLDAFIEEPRLACLTDALYGIDTYGGWHRIGRFKISFDLINPDRGSFQWINLDGVVGEYHAPPNIRHNANEGYGHSTCMGGDVHDMLENAKEKLDFPTIVSIMVRFPECRGTGNIASIQAWPSVSRCDVPQWYLTTFGV